MKRLLLETKIFPLSGGQLAVVVVGVAAAAEAVVVADVAWYDVALVLEEVVLLLEEVVLAVEDFATDADEDCMVEDVVLVFGVFTDAVVACELLDVSDAI